MISGSYPSALHSATASAVPPGPSLAIPDREHDGLFVEPAGIFQRKAMHLTIGICQRAGQLRIRRTLVSKRLRELNLR
jgi:hypothetical protein